MMPPQQRLGTGMISTMIFMSLSAQFLFLVAVILYWVSIDEVVPFSWTLSRGVGATVLSIALVAFTYQSVLHVLLGFVYGSGLMLGVALVKVMMMSVCMACDTHEPVENDCHRISCFFGTLLLVVYFGVFFAASAPGVGFWDKFFGSGVRAFVSFGIVVCFISLGLAVPFALVESRAGLNITEIIFFWSGFAVETTWVLHVYKAEQGVKYSVLPEL